MKELMRTIVKSDDVQDLLVEIREEGLVTPKKYEELCEAIQDRINSELDVLLLEPIEIASLIEEAIMIYSSKKQGTNFHVLSVDKSVDLAFQKQLGITDTHTLI